jgi:hypothetical protein
MTQVGMILDYMEKILNTAEETVSVLTHHAIQRVVVPDLIAGASGHCIGLPADLVEIQAFFPKIHHGVKV